MLGAFVCSFPWTGALRRGFIGIAMHRQNQLSRDCEIWPPRALDWLGTIGGFDLARNVKCNVVQIQLVRAREAELPNVKGTPNDVV
jgi:hypothetical protein